MLQKRDRNFDGYLWIRLVWVRVGMNKTLSFRKYDFKVDRRPKYRMVLKPTSTSARCLGLASVRCLLCEPMLKERTLAYDDIENSYLTYTNGAALANPPRIILGTFHLVSKNYVIQLLSALEFRSFSMQYVPSLSKI
ncbi:hypothetical protein GGR53DRAFT_514390 [Hypoxylon sp. FL1150]|nr:hypothetical protein GGR53DRAFT_514390 [Hypoxylon sp. FL1150]